jgi:hypothetical protein
MLACMILGVILLSGIEVFRFLRIDEHQTLLRREQVHLNVAQDLRASLSAAHLGLQRFVLDPQAQEAEGLLEGVDAKLARAKGLLVLMHQGGELRLKGGGDPARQISLAQPMPPELLALASALVPLVSGPARRVHASGRGHAS